MPMRLTELPCEEFSDRLAGHNASPGGGGAAALVGALGAALCSMAGAFTLGRPRFADVADEVRDILDEADDVRMRLTELVDDDVDGFAPLMEAYALPRDAPGRAEAVESATQGACMAPLAMMGECCRAVALLERMAALCPELMRSDVASGAFLVAAALQTSAVNVFVNAAALRDRAQASLLDAACDEMLDEWLPRAVGLGRSLLDEIRERGEAL